MNENEIQRLQFANTVRLAAESLRAEAEHEYLRRFNQENQRPSGEPEKTYNPTIEVTQIAVREWRKNNPLEKFIPAAVEQLRNIDKVIQQIA